MKKTLKLLSLAMLFALPLAACGGNESGNGSGSGESESGESGGGQEEGGGSGGGSGGGQEEGGGGSGGGGQSSDVQSVKITFGSEEDTSGSIDGVSWASDKNGGASAPVVKVDSEHGNDLRLYAKNTFTLSASSNITKAVFEISYKGLQRQADVSCSSGSMDYDMDAAEVTWSGSAKSITFTVGDKATHGTDGSSKAGQFDFYSISVSVGGSGGGSESGGSSGGGGEDLSAVEEVAAYMAEACTGDADAYEWDDEYECYSIYYFDDESADLCEAAQWALDKCPSGFSVYEEVGEYEDEGESYAYGSYDDGESIAIDVYSFDYDGSIMVEIDVYEFEYEE